MNRSEQVYSAFCEYAASRLESGEPLDPKELEQIVKFLKDQGIQEPTEVKESEVNPTLAKSFRNLQLQRQENG